MELLGDVLVRGRTVRLEANVTSAGQARQVLRDLAAEVGDAPWLDAAELACTEVVSNVVLHAHTAMELVVDVGADGLSVQVRDFSPVLPSQRSYDRQATTGRGMILVAALSAAHGVHLAGPEGKTVWFVIAGDPVESSEKDLLDAWDDVEWELPDAPEPTPADTVGVILRDLPPALWLAAREHHDALLRELTLYLAEHEDHQLDVSAADLARTLIPPSAWLTVEQAVESSSAAAQLPGALPAVPEPLDLTLLLPPTAGAAFAVLRQTLDAAEHLAVTGIFLGRPGLPEIIGVRDWVCDEVAAQLAGQPTSAWPEVAPTPGAVRRTAPGRTGHWDAWSVTGSDRPLIAADDTNHIVAISDSLAGVLGWDRADLVGRRLVSLIPTRYRDAHIAGFSRHVRTGESRILGVPLTLPVLRADGTELLCDVLIEQRPDAAVYVAMITAPAASAG